MKGAGKNAKAAARAKGKAPGAGKQKMQLIVLGVLSLLLVVVIVVQSGGSDTEYEVAALAADATVTPEVTHEPETPVTEDAPAARENPVLSQPPPEEGLQRNPFANFWSRDSEGGETIARLPPPQIDLGLTLPGGEQPVAVIDGRLHFVGEAIGGWTLAEVRPRAVVLQSPSEERLVVEMPVHLRVVEIPPGTAP